MVHNDCWPIDSGPSNWVPSEASVVAVAGVTCSRTSGSTSEAVQRITRCEEAAGLPLLARLLAGVRPAAAVGREVVIAGTDTVAGAIASVWSNGSSIFCIN